MSTPMHNDFFIDILRHGEPEGGSLWRGWQDDPLSETGWEQMHDALGDACPWDHIISSPLSRCHDFAIEQSVELDLPLQVIDAIKEMHFGHWEGKSHAEVWEEDHDQIDRFIQDPANYGPPGGESLPQFHGRVITAWNQLLDNHRGKNLLVVTHGGVIRAIVSHILGAPLQSLWRLEAPYACLTRIRVIVDENSRIHTSLVFHGGHL